MSPRCRPLKCVQVYKECARLPVVGGNRLLPVGNVPIEGYTAQSKGCKKCDRGRKGITPNDQGDQGAPLSGGCDESDNLKIKTREFIVSGWRH